MIDERPFTRLAAKIKSLPFFQRIVISLLDGLEKKNESKFQPEQQLIIKLKVIIIR